MDLNRINHNYVTSHAGKVFIDHWQMRYRYIQLTFIYKDKSVYANISLNKHSFFSFLLNKLTYIIDYAETYLLLQQLEVTISEKARFLPWPWVCRLKR